MKKLTKFDVILNIWVSLIINIALSAVLPALNKGAFHMIRSLIFDMGNVLFRLCNSVSGEHDPRVRSAGRLMGRKICVAV